MTLLCNAWVVFAGGNQPHQFYENKASLRIPPD